jgi:DNA-binding MarR family transcriptional regulator
MSKTNPGAARPDRYKREARAVVSELLERDIVPEDKRDRVVELLEEGEPLAALRVSESLNQRR